MTDEAMTTAEDAPEPNAALRRAAARPRRFVQAPESTRTFDAGMRAAFAAGRYTAQSYEDWRAHYFPSPDPLP